MKTNKIKNLQLAEELIKSCNEKNDTCLLIFAPRILNEGTFEFVGDPVHVVDGLYHLLVEAFKPNAEKAEIALGNAVLNAIYRVLIDKNRDVAISFAKSLNSSIEAAGEELDGGIADFEEIDDEDDGEDVFDPNSDECRDCDSYNDCLLEKLVAVAEKSDISEEAKKTLNKLKKQIDNQ